MKRMVLFLICLITLFNFAYADENGNEGIELTVTIIGIEQVDGRIMIGIVDNEEKWPVGEELDFSADPIVKGNIVSYAFTNIPAGTYAIAVYHDVNENRTLDKGLFGIPKEGYAFSNNKFGLFGPPKFKDVSFVLDKKLEIEIELKY